MPLTFRLRPARSRPPRTRHRAPGLRLLVALTGVLVLLVASAAHAATATVEGWGHGEALGLSGIASTSYVVPTPLPGTDEATAAAVGEFNSFVLTPSGVLAAGTGILGLGGAESLNAPGTLIAGTAGAKALATGYDATLIVQGDGTVLGFGENQYGSAGGAVGDATLTPSPIAGLANVTAVAAGGTFSAALESDGSVWAWGQAQSLGSVPAAAGPNTGTPTRVALPGGLKAVAIAAGYEHGLALLEDGSVWAWGGDSSGQIGNGIDEGEPVAAPVRVIAPPATGAPRVTAISAGSDSSFALYSDGSFQAWGDNGEGELGLGNGAQEVSVPTAPSAALRAELPENYPPLTQISALGSTTYAVAASDSGVSGAVLAWGGNGGAQLGFGEGVPTFAYAFPYTKDPGTIGQQYTEIPQRVGRLQEVPWLGVGSAGAVQIAPTEPTLRPVNGTPLPFFSHSLGTVSAPGSESFESPGAPTTVTRIHITGPNAGDFELVGYNTSGGVGEAEPLPLTVSSPGALTVYVRFIPSALGERFATLQVEGDGETASIQLSGYGTEPPGNTPGAVGGAGPAGPAGPAAVNGRNGTNGTNGKNGVVVFAANASKASVKPGHVASLRFVVGNGTTGGFPKTTLSVSAPKGLDLKGSRFATVASLAVGKSRTVTLKLKVGARARRGTYEVKVTWKLGNKTVTRSVRIRVR
jgi:alpha-tubulin suppressor-like RCC1 family protein